MQRIASTLVSDLSLSRIAFGLWRLTDWQYSPAERVALFEQMLDLGVTTFDLADIYGDYRCERFFGEALKLKPQLRERMEIVSKCSIRLAGEASGARINHYDTSGTHVRGAVENSLRDMGIEQMDLLLLHRPDPLMDAEALAAVLEQLVAEGKVKHLGVSNFLPHQVDLLQSRLSLPLVVNQVEVSLLHSLPMFDGQLDHCQQHRMIPMAWSPFAGGRLFSADDADAIRVQKGLHAMCESRGLETETGAMQLAVAWLLRHPANIVPVLGSGNLQRLVAALAALEMELGREEWFELLRAGRGRDVD
ncbi:aldo/keto reductase [Microbulbifer hydrolyticus]|uniref:Oxidoreductase n=1 Tax=Microbulbifer hydrolyticus TaxID=48074 RepID=A0A6P1TDM9_9GAMM|nr:aldo/keto reductase [Microbulbifer hydrolyticus]MBB5212517.1 putative oxidoreductase [Microbulbifer hydrolyticus]QHQ40904.1 oxidoreductase [Microbulbifer hydrolyticus]